MKGQLRFLPAALVSLALVAVLLLIGPRANAATHQACTASAAELSEGSAVWNKGSEIKCGELFTFTRVSMLLGTDLASTSLAGHITVLRLPAPGSGLDVFLYDKKGVQLGVISFGGVSNNCGEEDLTRQAETANTLMKFDRAPQVVRVEFKLRLGIKDWAPC